MTAATFAPGTPAAPMCQRAAHAVHAVPPAADEYVATFDPLVLEEAREGLRSDWAEACGGQAWPAEVAG